LIVARQMPAVDELVVPPARSLPAVDPREPPDVAPGESGGDQVEKHRVIMCRHLASAAPVPSRPSVTARFDITVRTKWASHKVTEQIVKPDTGGACAAARSSEDLSARSYLRVAGVHLADALPGADALRRARQRHPASTDRFGGCDPVLFSEAVWRLCSTPQYWPTN